MDNINRQILAAVSQGKKDELLKCARKALRPFFTNQQALANWAATFQLISAYNTIETYNRSNETDFGEGVLNVLAVYRQAYKKDAEKALLIIDSGRPEFMQKESFMHARRKYFTHLRKDLPDDLYDAVPQLTDHIDKIIGFSIQHIVFELFALWKLVQEDNDTPQSKLSFGTAIRSLSSIPSLRSIFQIGPNKVYVHDWRNIDAHTTYEVQNGKILCTYKDGKEQIYLTVDELYECYWQINKTSNIINVAKYIFEVEHTEELALLKNSRPLEASTGMRMKNIQAELLNEYFLPDPSISQDGPEDIPVIFVQDLLNSPDEITRSDIVAKYIVQICRTYKMNVGIVYCDRTWTPKQYIRLELESVDGVLRHETNCKLCINISPIALI